MHEAFVHAYWHSHHWVLVPKDVVENNLQSWMHKSILLLKDLTPSSEDAIDSCTQLFPTPQTSSCANKTAFYRLLLRNPNVHFPPRRVGSTWSPRPLSENRRTRGGGQLESRSQELCPNPSGNLPQLLCQGAAEQEAVLREQQWRRTTNLKHMKAGSCIWRACLIFINQLQTVPFSGSFLPSKSLTAVILTFKERSYFVLLDWHY